MSNLTKSDKAAIEVLAKTILEKEDNDFYEALWAEVERMASAKGVGAQDEREDTNLADIMHKTAEKMAAKILFESNDTP